jgi:hypothetical protein
LKPSGPCEFLQKEVDARTGGADDFLERSRKIFGTALVGSFRQ